MAWLLRQHFTLDTLIGAAVLVFSGLAVIVACRALGAQKTSTDLAKQALDLTKKMAAALPSIAFETSHIIPAARLEFMAILRNTGNWTTKIDGSIVLYSDANTIRDVKPVHVSLVADEKFEQSFKVLHSQLQLINSDRETLYLECDVLCETDDRKKEEKKDRFVYSPKNSRFIKV